jgi:multidrug resistance efflux pump
VPLTVVFEWWSPNHTEAVGAAKLGFYDRYGVSELYTYDQVTQELAAFVRSAGKLERRPTEGGVVSPILGIRLAVVEGELQAWRPDGQPFRTLRETDRERARAEDERARAEHERAEEAGERARAEEARARAEEARARAVEERARAEEERAQADRERARAEEERAQAEERVRQLEERLRALGLDVEPG